jgi:lipid II:glycine glycyltransferase (peptidoglycan interpeptide bridge formation enzyme)
VLITDLWAPLEHTQVLGHQNSRRPQTIWLNLERGPEIVWEGFHPQMRKGVRRAERGGVMTLETRDAGHIKAFVALCQETGRRKGFDARVSEDIIKLLIDNGKGGQDVETALIVGMRGAELGSGLFLIRVGKSIHQIWGASNRELRQERVGEAVQWAAMQWAFKRGCTLYDLEGIDPVNNVGVYEFKRRMGGSEVMLVGKQHYPLCVRGQLASWLDVHVH